VARKERAAVEKRAAEQEAHEDHQEFMDSYKKFKFENKEQPIQTFGDTPMCLAAAATQSGSKRSFRFDPHCGSGGAASPPSMQKYLPQQCVGRHELTKQFVTQQQQQANADERATIIKEYLESNGGWDVVSYWMLKKHLKEVGVWGQNMHKGDISKIIKKMISEKTITPPPDK